MKTEREKLIEELKKKYSYKNYNVGRDCLTIEMTVWHELADFILAERNRIVELSEALNNLINFTDQLCEDIKISKHYPSLEKAKETLKRAGVE